MSIPPPTAAPTCPVLMSDHKPCGRAIHPAPTGVDPVPVCLMHSRDPNKNKALFRQEIDAILNGNSAYNRPQDAFDFTAFVFPEANFSGATFTRAARFTGATFAHEANFRFSKFEQDTDFVNTTFTQSVSFFGVMFARKASFEGATFSKRAILDSATFAQDALFGKADFSNSVASFRNTEFGLPTHVLFHLVNKKDSAAGMRARFVGCLVEGIRFEDVNWYRPKSRLVLQDELDLGLGRGATHELVADAYRRLVNNFEKARQYELAEQCVIGEMEMRRSNPRNFILGGQQNVAKLYEKSRVAQWLGEHLSFLYAYRALSMYGSSYGRALAWLLALVFLFFPVLYGLTGLSHSPPRSLLEAREYILPATGASLSWGQAFRAGRMNRSYGVELLLAYVNLAIYSGEVATFQRERAFQPASLGSRALAIVEQIAVPGQLALFLFALRRRFRR